MIVNVTAVLSGTLQLWSTHGALQTDAVIAVRPFTGHPTAAIGARRPRLPVSARCLAYARREVKESSDFDHDVGSGGGWCVIVSSGRTLDLKDNNQEDDAMSKNTICLWYNKDAEEAARFYADDLSQTAR